MVEEVRELGKCIKENVSGVTKQNENLTKEVEYIKLQGRTNEEVMQMYQENVDKKFRLRC